MAAHGEFLTWVVPATEVGDYVTAGARAVIGVPERTGAYNLPTSRNVALITAHERQQYCVEVDDDLQRILIRDGDSWRPGTLSEAIERLTGILDETGAKLAGVPPTSNKYFARPGVRQQAFIIGSLSVTAPNPLRYDEDLPLKEDYDYTCRHLGKYGQVARCDDIIAEFRHYVNPGGAVSYRTDAIEYRVHSTLLERWPQYLRANPRRKHELIVRSRTAGNAVGLVHGNSDASAHSHL